MLLVASLLLNMERNAVDPTLSLQAPPRISLDREGPPVGGGILAFATGGGLSRSGFTGGQVSVMEQKKQPEKNIALEAPPVNGADPLKSGDQAQASALSEVEATPPIGSWENLKNRLDQIRPALHRRAPWIILTAMIILMAAALVRWDYFESGRRVQTTNNAYTHFDTVIIESKVSGYVQEVAFTDFQLLRAGETLITIENEEYEMAVMQARAKYDHALSNLANLELEENLQRAYVDQASAAVANTETRRDLAQIDYNRIAALGQRRVVAGTEVDTADSNLKAALASHRESQALLMVQQRKLELLAGERAVRQADVNQAKAALRQAEIELGYTKIIAPLDSVAGSCKIRAGELVKVGTQIVTLVPDATPYVIANYKETQLTNIHPGQQVDLKVDTFPGVKFKGRVVSVSPATGATYSLMPTDNSAGNFTKVVQRIPVRIEFDDNLGSTLRAGMSVTASIDTDNDRVLARPAPGRSAIFADGGQSSPTRSAP